MTLMASLLADIEAFLSSAGVSESAFGIAAMNDGKLVSRVRGGANITVKTIDRIRAYIAAERAKHPEWKRADAKPRKRAA